MNAFSALRPDRHNFIGEITAMEVIPVPEQPSAVKQADDRNQIIPPAMARPRRGALTRKLVKFTLLVLILVVHFISRRHLASGLPLPVGNNYPFVYRTALAVMAGKGFHAFRFSDAPESVPVVEFLYGQRNAVSRDEFRRFLAGPDGTPVNFPLPDAHGIIPPYAPQGELKKPGQPLETTRVLDIYTTALLWRIFGIRWSVFFTFCSLASTSACLMVFFIARRLGGGFWPGLAAALLYLACPQENVFCIRALRDISPLWFAALSFAVFLCLAERFRSPLWNWAILASTGFVCALGCGWRSDAMLFTPFLGAAAVGFLVMRRRSWRYLSAGIAAFAVGVAAPPTLIRLAGCPSSTPLIGFHIAHYGEYARCNLFGLENTFQTSRDDVQTALTAQQFYADHNPQSPPLEYLSPAYGTACFRIYREEIEQNVFHWTVGFPSFYRRALAACRLRDLPVNGEWLAPPARPGWLRPIATWVLDPLARAGAWLFAVGVCVSLLRPGRRYLSLCLAIFSVFYAVVLFAVLPEMKHVGPLILPVSVFGGVGLASLSSLAKPAQWITAMWQARGRAVALAAAALLLAALWGLTCGGAYCYSLACRRELLDDLTKRASCGAPAPEAIRGPQLFSVTLHPEDGPHPVGYLLRIEAGAGDPFLECRHLHHACPRLPTRFFSTRHRLSPGREQCFFVSCRRGAAFEDRGAYVCTALLDGNARFLSCTRLDLADWGRLPVSTVFIPGEYSPGNPVVGGRTGVTRYDGAPGLNFDGLSEDELRRYRKSERPAFSIE